MFTMAAAGAFFARPLVKILGGALLVGLLVWFAVHQFNNYTDGIREDGRLAGRKEVTVEFQAIVDENNKVNRRVEAKVDQSITKFFGKLETTLAKVRGDSAKIAGDIIEQIDHQPQTFSNKVCITPQGTIDSRNAIRRLGPVNNGPAKLPTE